MAYDSYRNGNYDVFVRTATSPTAWGKEMPIAASATYEAYPSIAYDPAGTLWVAYEEGGERWGKDSRIILLDPAQDVATLEVVKTMIRKHRSAREQVAQIEKLARNEYLADVKVLFPEVSA